ncbi:MAG TPA: hypothetical protein VN397_03300 [Candidatus Methylomirabilis sp.]|nr:hypothetical protein [Candidatus Methylomirabilis sp.]
MAAPSESGYRPLYPLSRDDAAWIEQLRDGLWEKHHTTNARAYCRDWWIERDGRAITKEEWSRLESLIATHGLPCVMCEGTFGFGLCITVFDHAPVPHMQPEGLISLTNKHLEDHGNAYDRHETAWQIFSAHTHTPENERVCRFYGLNLPREREHYDY